MKNMRQLINAVMVTEGTWAIPDTAEAVADIEELMKQPLPLGPGGKDATNAVGVAIGDDGLFDDLGDAGDEDPNADARPIIADWIIQNIRSYPDMPADLASKLIAVAKTGGAEANPQMELPLDEDSVDDDKTDQLNNLFMSVDALKQEVEELARLDAQEGASGVGDLHDQITTMYNLLDKFDDVIDRSTNIVPLRQGKY